MRIKRIDLSWFRGAAELAPLDTLQKSVVVYGKNGAGKSSFVDAIEYVLRDGRIGHLRHEYSGSTQVRGTRNTKAPDTIDTWFRIELDNSDYTAKISQSGSSTSSGSAKQELISWPYHQVVLRQDEVADFISGTKGDKYSVLLPLLGLQRLEDAAENLRRLGTELRKRSLVEDLRSELKYVDKLRGERLGEVSDEDIEQLITQQYERYLPGKPRSANRVADCKSVQGAIKNRMDALDADKARHLAISDVSQRPVPSRILAVRDATGQIAEDAGGLVKAQLGVLQSARVFVDAIEHAQETTADIQCPACGSKIAADAFRSHVAAEEERLGALLEALDERSRAVGELCDEVRRLKEQLEHPAAQSWRAELVAGGLSETVSYLSAIDTEALRKQCSEADLGKLEKLVIPLIDAAANASAAVPSSVSQITGDRDLTILLIDIVGAKFKMAKLEQLEALLAFVKDLEDGVRRMVGEQTKATIESLTADIQRLWSRLHPTQVIANVRLQMPDDAAKAIDIHLRFHDSEQDSPRLTLSEGYRNSLGLCIFLALALQDQTRPLILDDVVISLDREHRGAVAELLEAEFGKRQVLLFTHDRDWFAELRRQLDESRWEFRTLLPYKDPGIGIRWAERQGTFDEARALLSNAPHAAGNTARSIMQTEMSWVADQVELRLPYRHRERNDHRNPDEIMRHFVATARRCFQRKEGNTYQPNVEAVEAFDLARRLLATWGNNASHTLDVVRPEAESLITACESAIAALRCQTPSCEVPVYRLRDEQSETVQCRCSALRWRYGKDL